jgi:hypothetical protein
MELEAPADAWYTWVAVALVSIAVGGIVLGLPTRPPPDAAGAANTVDRVATSDASAAATYEHDAAKIRIGTRQLWLRNDAGTAHASVTFDSLTPLHATEGRTREAVQSLLDGRPPRAVLADTTFESQTELRKALAEARRNLDREGAEWRPAAGQIRVRVVAVDGQRVILVSG